MVEEKSPDEAVLLITSRCPHCEAVMQSLTDLLKQGNLGHLEIINIENHAELAAEYGVRSVPHFRWRDIVLTGLHSKAELLEWLKIGHNEDYRAALLSRLFQGGDLARAITLVKKDTDFLSALLQIAADAEADITERLGISAVIESLEGSEILRSAVPEFIRLAGHDSVTVRGDAAHFLGLTHASQVEKALQLLTEDPDQSVAEIARDSLEVLKLDSS